MKVALVNVKYSANLGDGLIAECLEWALAKCLSDAVFVSVDLAGRTSYADSAGRGRGHALAVLAQLPKPLRQVAVSGILRTLIATRYRTIWNAQLEGCTHAVLGGGQLMADADLNFPHKIKAVAALTHARRIPSTVFAVGVSGSWSKAGRLLFHKAMRNFSPGFVAVRDAASAASWNAHFSGTDTPAAQLCRDPGLLAAQVYSLPVRPSRERPRAGLGVIHPHTLNLHSSGAALTLPDALHVWKQMIEALLTRGLDVALFTNGPADDEKFLEAILAELSEADASRVARLPKPRRPRDLVDNIASCEVIAAHRLHANIVAFACKVPHVGFGWDAKLPAFFDSVGRREFVTGDVRAVPAAAIADQMLGAMKAPLPAEDYDRVIAETWAGIRTCAAALA